MHQRQSRRRPCPWPGRPANPGQPGQGPAWARFQARSGGQDPPRPAKSRPVRRAGLTAQAGCCAIWLPIPASQGMQKQVAGALVYDEAFDIHITHPHRMTNKTAYPPVFCVTARHTMSHQLVTARHHCEIMTAKILATARVTPCHTGATLYRCSPKTKPLKPFLRLGGRINTGSRCLKMDKKMVKKGQFYGYRGLGLLSLDQRDATLYRCSP